MGVPIRELLEGYRTPAEWDDLRGIAAFDAHNALYQFLSIIRQKDGTPLMDPGGRVTSHLSGLLFRNQNFLEKGIRPVYVFDGAPPSFKQDTIETRRAVREDARERWQEALARGDLAEAGKYAKASSKLDGEVIGSSKRLLTLMGIPFLEAPSEGEAQIAHMTAKGDTTYAVSQDYDTLLFGTPVLVRNLTVSGKRRLHGRMVNIVPEKIHADKFFAGLSITRTDLIRIGILVGTDFNDGVPGIGPKKGIKAVREGKFDSIAKDQLRGVDTEDIINFFEHPPVTDQYHLSWKEPDAEGITRMLCDEYSFAPERIKKALGVVSEQPGQKTLSSWF